MHQEIEQERELNRIDDKMRETTPYKELIVNNAEKIKPLLTQTEQWSILSNTLNYIQYDMYPKNYHSLGISTVNKCKKNPCTKDQLHVHGYISTCTSTCTKDTWKFFKDIEWSIQ